VLALDALYLAHPKTQFEEIKVHRELVKCFCGFRSNGDEGRSKNSTAILEDDNEGITQVAIATGNWGCGAFNGDIELKCKI
jgi:poly(ADP-ribose) glycohydrolase